MDSGDEPMTMDNVDETENDSCKKTASKVKRTRKANVFDELAAITDDAVISVLKKANEVRIQRNVLFRRTVEAKNSLKSSKKKAETSLNPCERVEAKMEVAIATESLKVIEQARLDSGIEKKYTENLCALGKVLPTEIFEYVLTRSARRDLLNGNKAETSAELLQNPASLCSVFTDLKNEGDWVSEEIFWQVLRRFGGMQPLKQHLSYVDAESEQRGTGAEGDATQGRSLQFYRDFIQKSLEVTNADIGKLFCVIRDRIPANLFNRFCNIFSWSINEKSIAKQLRAEQEDLDDGSTDHENEIGRRRVLKKINAQCNRIVKKNAEAVGFMRAKLARDMTELQFYTKCRDLKICPPFLNWQPSDQIVKITAWKHIEALKDQALLQHMESLQAQIDLFVTKICDHLTKVEHMMPPNLYDEYCEYYGGPVVIRTSGVFKHSVPQKQNTNSENNDYENALIEEMDDDFTEEIDDIFAEDNFSEEIQEDFTDPVVPHLPPPRILDPSMVFSELDALGNGIVDNLVLVVETTRDTLIEERKKLKFHLLCHELNTFPQDLQLELGVQRRRMSKQEEQKLMKRELLRRVMSTQNSVKRLEDKLGMYFGQLQELLDADLYNGLYKIYGESVGLEKLDQPRISEEDSNPLENLDVEMEDRSRRKELNKTGKSTISEIKTIDYFHGNVLNKSGEARTTVSEMETIDYYHGEGRTTVGETEPGISAMSPIGGVDSSSLPEDADCSSSKQHRGSALEDAVVKTATISKGEPKISVGCAVDVVESDSMPERVDSTSSKWQRKSTNEDSVVEAATISEKKHRISVGCAVGVADSSSMPERVDSSSDRRHRGSTLEDAVLKTATISESEPRISPASAVGVVDSSSMPEHEDAVLKTATIRETEPRLSVGTATGVVASSSMSKPVDASSSNRHRRSAREGAILETVTIREREPRVSVGSAISVVNSSSMSKLVDISSSKQHCGSSHEDAALESATILKGEPIISVDSAVGVVNSNSLPESLESSVGKRQRESSLEDAVLETTSKVLKVIQTSLPKDVAVGLTANTEQSVTPAVPLLPESWLQQIVKAVVSQVKTSSEKVVSSPQTSEQPSLQPPEQQPSLQRPEQQPSLQRPKQQPESNAPTSSMTWHRRQNFNQDLNPNASPLQLRRSGEYFNRRYQPSQTAVVPNVPVHPMDRPLTQTERRPTEYSKASLHPNFERDDDSFSYSRFVPLPKNRNPWTERRLGDPPRRNPWTERRLGDPPDYRQRRRPQFGDGNQSYSFSERTRGNKPSSKESDSK